MVERPRKKEIVGRAPADRDSDARTIELLDRGQWRFVTNEVSALDDYVRSGIGDFRGTNGIDRQERNVPG